jgi:hypothetical protein
MLNALTIRPPLADLYKLIDKVPRYPLSNRQLIDLAAKYESSQEVIDFYRTFNDRVYKSRDELAAVSEQVDLMRQEEAEMPRESARDEEY